MTALRDGSGVGDPCVIAALPFFFFLAFFFLLFVG